MRTQHIGTKDEGDWVVYFANPEAVTLEELEAFAKKHTVWPQRYRLELDPDYDRGAERSSGGTPPMTPNPSTALSALPRTPCYALHFGDCADGAPFKADAIVTDPPYQIGKAWGRKSHGKRGKSPLWGVDPEWDTLHPLVMSLPAMASKCIIWGGNNYPLPAAPHWFVWDKLQENRGADCELAWTAGTSAHKVFRMSRIDAYHNKAEGLKKTHPTQKPLPLMVWCLQQLKLPPGAMVCDPFMGSGTTGVACARLGLSFTGWEQDATHYARAKERIEAEYSQHNSQADRTRSGSV